MARQLGSQISALIKDGQVEGAVKLITPTLLSPTSFSKLDRIGEQIGSTSLDESGPFFNNLAAKKYMGSWVIIGSALRCYLRIELERALADCREFIIQADVWYATDTFGERVVGPALLVDFHPALKFCLPGERIQTAGCGVAWEWRCICGSSVLAGMRKWQIEPGN